MKRSCIFIHTCKHLRQHINSDFRTFLWLNPLSNRREFLTRLALLFAGALMVPSTMISNNPVGADERTERPSIGRKQRELLAACQKTAQRMGVFRDSTNITHYALDGEIEMTWTMILPPEKSIDDSTRNKALEILKVIGCAPDS